MQWYKFPRKSPKNPVDALNRQGEHACWTTLVRAAQLLDQLGGARALVLHRCAWGAPVKALCAQARAAGIPVGFDVDDFLFSRQIIDAGWFHYGTVGSDEERTRWATFVDGLRVTALAADFLVVPTSTLAAAARELGKPVIELPNGFSPENLALADLLLSHKQGGEGSFRIGYASGSPTHDRDFTEIVEPLARVLRELPQVQLTVIGELGDAPLRALPADRIERRPFVEHVNLAYELSRLDLNLAPLERNPFCDAKSPLKYYEAALVGVPSLVTANPVYQSLIEHGVNGLLAVSADDWVSGIKEAMVPGRSAALGRGARAAVIGRFRTDRLVGRLIGGLGALTPGEPGPFCARSSGLRERGARRFLSVIVVFHNMSREAPRTLYSLSRAYQRELDDLDYEVIALDHGSTEPLDPAMVRSMGSEFVLHRVETKDPSPVAAINDAVARAGGEHVMINIDGARILSPGLLSWTARAHAQYPNAFVHTLAWQLGPGLQNATMLQGYNQVVEDQLLAECNWMEDGYRLFDRSALAGSSRGGFFSDLSESNCFSLAREHYLRLGGFNPGFRQPGAGIANLDFFNRAMMDPQLTPVRLLGEGTFHQFNGGVATNVPQSEHPIASYQREYEVIYGERWRPLTGQCHIFIGRVDGAAARFLRP
jgi:glycosyltransferase involved in cell wall biosynthesis